MTEAILLVGGYGTRLRPLTNHRPKPMLPLATLPVTEHQLAMAAKVGIKRIVLATAYLSDVFTPYFGDGSKWGLEIKYAFEKEPLGTAGAIRNAAELLSEGSEVVILNGDVISSHNLAAQLEVHRKNNADVTLHLTTVEDARNTIFKEPQVYFTYITNVNEITLKRLATCKQFWIFTCV